jgi:hypothetical protein
LIWVEILGYLGFIIYTMNIWAGNVDNTMIYGGALSTWIPKTQTMAGDVMGRRWLGLARTAFYAMLYMPVIIWVVEQFKYKNNALVGTESFTDSDSLCHSPKYVEGVPNYLISIRFLVGAYFLVLISAICLIRG